MQERTKTWIKANEVIREYVKKAADKVQGKQ